MPLPGCIIGLLLLTGLFNVIAPPHIIQPCHAIRNIYGTFRNNESFLLAIHKPYDYNVFGENCAVHISAFLPAIA
jgi:hypothetical protein